MDIPRKKAVLTKVESLSHVEDALIIGNKKVKDLKKLAGRDVDLVEKGEFHVRADLLDLNNLDSSLAKLGVAVDNSNVAEESGMAEGDSEEFDWEIDLSKISLKSVIAKGTFGTVHRGTYLGQEVAVKLLNWGEEGENTHSREALAQVMIAFKQEVMVWSTLKHPNVTQFVGARMGSRKGFSIQSEVGEDSGVRTVGGNVCCVVLEYMPAGTLKSYLIKHHSKKLPFKTVMRLALDVARGLEYLHSQRIVHRDVKSENLLMDKKGTVKIADFGVARVEAVNGDMTEKTGTLGYMAPEVLSGKKYNHKADVYSFGICLWEIYVCDMPFPSLNVREMISVVNQGLRPHIPGVCPKPLASVMEKCWDQVPDKRPSMHEVTKLLEEIDVRKGKGMTPAMNVPTKNGCFCF